MAGHKRFKDGAWRLTVEGPRDPLTGRRRPVNATVRAPNNRAGAQAADLELAKLVVAVAAGKVAPPSNVTVAELVERYVEARRKPWEERSPGQPDWTLNVARRWIHPYIGEVPVAKLRPVDIDLMYQRWREGSDERDPLAEATVRRMHNILRSALQQGVRWDLRVDNPAERIEPPSPANRDRDAPSDEVLKAIIDAAPPHYACFLRLAALTGARPGQLVGLRWSDIDLEDASVLFTKAYARVKGGMKEKGTKRGVKTRVALDSVTVAQLRAHRTRCAEAALSVGVRLGPKSFVFAARRSPDSSEPWNPNAASKAWASLISKIPGAAGVRAYDLRHWLATTMFEDGYDPVTVAHRGGWSSPNVPLAVYGHRRPAKDRRAANDLAARLDGLTDG